MLIEGWKKAHKFWSVRLGVIGTAITAVFLAAPEAALHAWALMPEDVKTLLPPDVIKFLGVFILGSSFIARIVKQPKIHGEKDDV
jgi:hypothetical protein